MVVGGIEKKDFFSAHYSSYICESLDIYFTVSVKTIFLYSVTQLLILFP